MKLSGKKDIITLKMKALEAADDNALQQVNAVCQHYQASNLHLLHLRYVEAQKFLQDTKSIPTSIKIEAEHAHRAPIAIAHEIIANYENAVSELSVIDAKRLILRREIEAAETPAQIFRLTGVR